MDDLKMRPGRIELGASSLELAYSALLPPASRDQALEITDLLTCPSERGNNSANSLMQEVCDQADACNMLLLLMPQAFGQGGLTTEQLTDWYIRKHGFTHLQKSPAVILVRMPRTAAQKWAEHEREQGR